MSTETLETCYRALGLAPDAGFDEVKYAYRVLVKRWHPDRFATDTDGQRQALEAFSYHYHAYETLRAHQSPETSHRPRRGWLQRGVTCPGRRRRLVSWHRWRLSSSGAMPSNRHSGMLPPLCPLLDPLEFGPIGSAA